MRVFWSAIGSCLPLAALLLIAGPQLEGELYSAPGWALSGIIQAAAAAPVRAFALRRIAPAEPSAQPV